MNKLSEDSKTDSCTENELPVNEPQNVNETPTETQNLPPMETKTTGRKLLIDDDEKEILKFTMLFNKFNSDLKRNLKTGNEDEKQKKNFKYIMFFNKG